MDMDMDTEKPVEARAEVVGSLSRAPEPAVSYTLPTATVGNLSQVEAFVSSVEAFFAGCSIDPCDREQVKALKGLRADVAKAAKAIDDRRKSMDRDVKAAMADADGALNALRDRLRAVYDATGEQVRAAEDVWLEGRAAMLSREYEALAPDLAPLVPLESFTAREPRLLQHSWGGSKACDELGRMISEAVADRSRLAGMALAFPAEADMAYCRTLDIKAALDEDTRLREAAAALEEHERRAAELEAAVEARRDAAGGPQEPESAPNPPEAVTPPETGLWELSAVFEGDRAFAAEVGRALRSLGVSGTIRRAR